MSLGGVPQLLTLGHEITLRFLESAWLARDFGDLDFAERKFVAGLSSCSFAGSDAGEQALWRDLSAEIFVGYFYEDSRNVA
jgi:hypothetical protein